MFLSLHPSAKGPEEATTPARGLNASSDDASLFTPSTNGSKNVNPDSTTQQKRSAELEFDSVVKAEKREAADDVALYDTPAATKAEDGSSKEGRRRCRLNTTNTSG